ncbi:Exostosin family protein [Perilla frutescens var. hirtella]|uniref:Exostosin family protein n=1 Tax=Perilla frutescens var. hirtella TaxID=608512 RepID=A0AAD4JCD1_PERFH|nr:Exostosin family protein [Perilla frutescens var. hirtella]
MGTDFSRKCQVESRRVVWIVALVLGSVLIIQYFDLPYGDRVLSLFPLGKPYFNLSDANRGINGHTGYSGQQSNLLNNSSPSMHKSEGSVSKDVLLGNRTADINHTDEEDSIVRAVSVVPEKASNTSERFNPSADISPSSVEIGIAAPPNEANDALDNVSTGNVADVSPSISVADDTTATTSGGNAGVAASTAYLSVAPAPFGMLTSTAVSPSVSDDHNTALESGENERIAASPTTLDVSSSTTLPPSESVSPTKLDIDVGAPVHAYSPPITANETGTFGKENIEKLNSPVAPSEEHSSATNSPPSTEQPKTPENPSVPSSPLWPSAADQELLDARSYELMEQKLKVYIYKDGNRPVFHNPRLRGIYASEGWFMKHMEASSQFVTSNPGEAHIFYLPFSSQLLVEYVYVKDSHSFDDINNFLKNYVESIKIRHPFWNRTDGADHFLVGCHDWAPYETKHLMANCIRALCNSDVKEGFEFGKDVSLPETHIQSPQNPMKLTGGKSAYKRSILAFFAGKMHGKVRPLLLEHWENKDPDMKISGPIRKAYVWHMQNSKYCICAKGYEVNSPRVVEAILYGCVPVIISDNFVPPFFDVLNWETFAVFVLEKDIPNLKNILISISDRRYVVTRHEASS